MTEGVKWHCDVCLPPALGLTAAATQEMLAIEMTSLHQVPNCSGSSHPVSIGPLLQPDPLSCEGLLPSIGQVTSCEVSPAHSSSSSSPGPRPAHLPFWALAPSHCNQLLSTASSSPSLPLLPFLSGTHEDLCNLCHQMRPCWDPEDSVNLLRETH